MGITASAFTLASLWEGERTRTAALTSHPVLGDQQPCRPTWPFQGSSSYPAIPSKKKKKSRYSSFASSVFKGMWRYKTCQSQNVSLACGSLTVENNQGPKDKGRNFDSLSNCLEELDKGPIPRIELSAVASAKNTGQKQPGTVAGVGWWGTEPWEQSPLLGPTVPAWPSKYLFTKHLLHVNCLPLLWSLKPLPPHPLLSLGWRRYLRWELRPFWWVTSLFHFFL